MSLAVHRVDRYAHAQAVAFAEEVMGSDPDWRASLRAYRLDDSFQEDWKAEGGRWLLFARDQGFLEPLTRRCLAQERAAARRRHGATEDEDAARRLWAELAPAMVAYYLGATGWTFCSWLPAGAGSQTPGLRLRSPAGGLTDVAVRSPPDSAEWASGQPRGQGRQTGFALEERARPSAPEAGVARMLVLVPERRDPIDLESLAEQLLGTPIDDGRDGWSIGPGSRGAFGRRPHDDLHAVVELSLRRERPPHAATDETLYRCTVLANPWVSAPTATGTAAFPHARVFALEGRSLVWGPDEPEWCAAFRSGLRCP